MLEEFEAHLRRSNLSENTISSYLLTIRMYQQLSGEITKQNLLAFKGYLIETYKPKTSLPVGASTTENSAVSSSSSLPIASTPASKI